MADSYVLGVDSGGAKTIALLADLEGRVLGAARRGIYERGARPTLDQAMAEVAALCREAVSRAGVSAEHVALGVFGLTGADWPEDHEPRAALLCTEGVAQRVVVKNDMFVGLRAGTDWPYGIVIGAGSGTNAAAIAPDGREWAFGYYATGGGGGDTAHKAFEAILRSDDGRGPATLLSGMALAKLGYPTVEAMLRAYVAGQVTHRAMHSLCPLVFDAACYGDAVAVGILVQQGQTLAEYAVALIRRFEMGRLEFDLVLSGSMFKGRGPLLRDTIAQAVHHVAPLARLVRPRCEPAVGGLLLAYDALGLPVTPAMYDRLATTSPGEEFFSTAS